MLSKRKEKENSGVLFLKEEAKSRLYIASVFWAS